MFKNLPLFGEPAGSTRQLRLARVLLAVYGFVFRPLFSYTRTRASLRVAAASLVVAGLLVGGWLLRPAAAHATPANTINFQARLENRAGAIAPDGTYNVEFKLYSAGSGGSALWTEDYLVSASNGIRTANGYLTANLGSVTPFPNTINWGQQLYLTMNIGGTASGASWDGEMSPRLSLTSVPSAFALNSYNASTGYTGSLTVAQVTGGNQTFVVPDQGAAGSYTLLTTAAANGQYIQNGTAPQVGANFNIGGNGTIGGLLSVTGNSTLGGTLGVTGATTLSSTLAVSGNATFASQVGVNMTAPTATISASSSPALTGTGTISSAGTAVTGVGTSFTTQLHAGDALTVNGQTAFVSVITDNTHLTTTAYNFNPAISGQSFTYTQPVERLVETTPGTGLTVQTAAGGVGLAVYNSLNQLGFYVSSGGYIYGGNGLGIVGATAINNSGNATTTIGNASSATSVGGTFTVTGITTLSSLTTAGIVTNTASGQLGTVASIPVANGGTGLTATPGAGQIPIGNGTGYTLSTLTAGTGIGIANAAGSITISNTATSTLSGDVTGSITSNTVSKLQGNTLTTSGVAAGNFLQYNGSAWVNQSLSGDATVSGTGVLTVANGAITAAKIANATITNTQLAGGAYTSITGVGTLGSLAVSGTATFASQVGINTLTPTAGLSINGGSAQVGTGTISSSGATVTGIGTSFLSQLHPGDVITAAGQSEFVKSVTSDTQFSTGGGSTFSPAISGASFTYTQPVENLVSSTPQTGLSIQTGGSGPAIAVFNTSGQLSYYVNSGGFVSANAGLSVTGATTINNIGNATTTIGNASSATSVGGALTVSGITTLSSLSTAGIVTNTASGQLGTVASIPVANGGTGLTAAPAAGQIPIGNGTGYTLSSLTAGTGIGIANASGSITITNTASSSLSGDVTGSVTNNAISKLQGTIVSTTSVAAGNFLQYNGSAWVNQSISGDATVSSTGVLTVANGAITAAKIASGTITNTQLASGSFTNITGVGTLGSLAVTGATTSGSLSAGAVTDTALNSAGVVINSAAGVLGTTAQLPAATGGTGVNGAAAANGTLLIGNGTGYTLHTLTAGTGIGIANTAGNITISNTATSTLTGDVTGNISSNTVSKLQGTTLTTSAVATGNFLQYNGTAWVNQSLSGDATVNGSGVLTVANGAITAAKIASGTITNTQLASGSFTNITGVGTLTAGTWNAGTVGVAYGGTGSTTLAANGVLYGNGTGAIQTAVGTTGQCLTGTTGAAPSWTTCSTAAAGATPGGTAGGDLSGSYPNPQVAGIRGVAVNITSLTTANFLQYNGSAWVNQSISGDATISATGVLTVANGAITAAKIASGTITNTQLASGSFTNITGVGTLGSLAVSGAFSAAAVTDSALNSAGIVTNTSAGLLSTVSSVPVANGGTGLTATPTNGQLPIGNGTGYTLGTLTAGTGITISNTAGSITISAPTAGSAAGGDLSGTLPNPTVVGIQGKPITLTALAANNMLVYNGTAWVNAAVAGDVTSSLSGNTNTFTIAAGAVTGAKIANNTITATNIVNNTITNTQLASGSFTNITGVGTLTAGSIGSGFGTIATTSSISGANLISSGSVQGSTLSISSAAGLGSLNVSGNTTLSTLGVSGAITGNSSLTLGVSSATSGSIVFNNSANANTVTLQSAAQSTGSYTLSIPSLTGNATICTDNVICSGYLSTTAAAAGYIQNTTTQQVGANFNIDGNGVIGGTLNVTGTTTLGALSVSSPATFGTTLTVTGLATFNGGATATLVTTPTVASNTSTLGLNTVSAGGILSTNASTIQSTNSGNTAINLSNAGTTTLVLRNSGGGGGGVANFDLADGSLELGNTPTVVLTNSGVLQNVTYNGNVIGAAYGGTGQSSYAVGDLLYASSTSALNRLADVGSGSCLRSGGTGAAPLWGSCDPGSVTTMGALDTYSGASTGATISNNTLYLQSAGASQVGLVNTAAQSFAGDKSFTGNVGIGVTAGSTATLNVSGSATGTNFIAQFTNTYATAGTTASILNLNYSGLNCQGNVAPSIGSTNDFIDFNALVGRAGSIRAVNTNGSCSSNVHLQYNTGGADYAEYFQTDSNNAPSLYDLVSFESATDNSLTEKATNPNLPIVGAVSGNSGFVGNAPVCPATETDAQCQANIGSTNALVALTGQVDVRVNSSRGAIAVGDPIGLSTVAGEGAKQTTSGYIVGYAMQSLSGSSGIIQVLIRPQFYTAPSTDVLQGSSLGLSGDANINGNMTVAQNLNVGGLTSLNNLVVNGNATIVGTLTAHDAEFDGVLTVGGHIISKGAAPAVALGAALGAGNSSVLNSAPTVSISGTDGAGTISFTSGQQQQAAGVLAQLTFAQAYNTAYSVVVSPDNGASGGLQVYTVKTPTGFNIVTDQVPQPGQQYTFDYIVLGSQQVATP